MKKLSQHFSVSELVNPDIIKKLGEIRAANFISPFLIQTLEVIRARFGPIVINGEFRGLTFTNSGLRKASYYKKLGIMIESYSTHQYGNTADCKFPEATPAQIYDYILDNPDEFPFIVRMENAHITESWLHIECGKYRDKIEVFNP